MPSTKFVWGRLRFILGFGQMFFVAAAAGSLITIGLDILTWILIIAATLLAAISRLLYHGRKQP